MGYTAMSSAAPQHLLALQHANRVRLARAELKRKVAADGLSAAEVIVNCPWEAASMEISDLLMSQRRWGRARCRRLLVSLGLPENKQLGREARAARRQLDDVPVGVAEVDRAEVRAVERLGAAHSPRLQIAAPAIELLRRFDDQGEVVRRAAAYGAGLHLRVLHARDDG